MSFDFKFTVDDLKAMIGSNPYLKYWHAALCEICPNYGIDTPQRLAAFIAQCAHESGNFRILRENLNYRAETLMKTWPKYFPTMEIAKMYEKKPQMIANRAYANRMSNGDEASGDGWRYLGRGLIQLTGKENYTWFGASIGVDDMDEVVEYLGTFEGAVQSACWFWEQRELNNEADAGDIKTMTKKINGGYIGLDDRIKHYQHALHVLGA